MITNATSAELHEALARTNKQYSGNIEFKEIKPISSTRNRFTLTVKDSKATGSRVSQEGRRIHAACWHVHGHFFDHLFVIRDSIYVDSRGTRITKSWGNWADINIGSQMYPFMYSESCDHE